MKSKILPKTHIIPSHDVGKESRERNPGFGYCSRCGVSWNDIGRDMYYDMIYRSNSGFFVCCKKCWAASTLEERIKYANDICDQWDIAENHYPPEWDVQYEDMNVVRNQLIAAIKHDWIVGGPNRLRASGVERILVQTKIVPTV